LAQAAAAPAEDGQHYSGQGDYGAGDRPERVAGHRVVAADVAQACQLRHRPDPRPVGYAIDSA